MVYGETRENAEVKVTAVTFRVLAERAEQAKKLLYSRLVSSWAQH
jgi:hypothetical protein